MGSVLTDPAISIVVMNHNYGRFLRRSIDSAVSQRDRSVEVVVVDDASTDGSRAVIKDYGERIKPVLLEENRGQIGAFSAALESTSGEVVITLDADDELLPSAAESIVEAWHKDPVLAKVHWPLVEVDADGMPTGQLRPRDPLPEGDLLHETITLGPDSHLTSPTSGNAWSRAFLKRVLPGPASSWHRGLDAYLCNLAPLFGRLGACRTPQGIYRVHGSNASLTPSSDVLLERRLRRYEVLAAEYVRWCDELGYAADPAKWHESSWFVRLKTALDEIAAVIPPGERFILVDETQWNLDTTPSRRPLPFPERDGQYWGLPADSAAARYELLRQRRQGVRFIVFAWPAFWWFDHYREFTRWLEHEYPCILRNPRLVIFRL